MQHWPTFPYNVLHRKPNCPRMLAARVGLFAARISSIMKQMRFATRVGFGSTLRILCDAGDCVLKAAPNTMAMEAGV